MNEFHLPYYLDFLSSELLGTLEASGEPVEGVDGLTVAPGLRDEFPDVETVEGLRFAVELYHAVRDDLREVLDQRKRDRAFVDRVEAACAARNVGRDFDSPDYETVIGRADSKGRIVVGPSASDDPVQPVAVPDWIAGEQVTLFGPPDTAKLSINAMNALHRRPADEPSIVTNLVDASGEVPRWGADNEDSKTPIMRDFLLACRNLMGCFDHSLRFVDEQRGKTYALADAKTAKPIKRIPGLALPDGNHLVDGNPLPLHLYDFALHLFHNWDKEEALVFYVPKLENEEEAGYLKTMIEAAERRIAELHPEYRPGTVRLFIVFENPRAIFRIREIATTLAPHFLGGSLGWHDFLASTARLFRNDPRYRIPVKADPNIVINHIRESHEILVRSLEPLGGITIGGMYGVLYEGGNEDSYEVSMVGYIKDVVTQLKRGLDGFWVAHPDFVRPGIALVEAFRQWQEGDEEPMMQLIAALVPNPDEHEPLRDFVLAADVPGLSEDDPGYLRGVLAADLETSDVIANHDPEEVRYNVFQALQYLADWLGGNGCVALPAKMTNASGEEVFVRVMDDLATTERSRWELWAEVAHGRVPEETFETILAEEVAFIRGERDDPSRRVAVTWDGENARWYPVAVKLLRQLVTDPEPPEFVTELLLPFTFDCVRSADDPWAEAVRLHPGKYEAASTASLG